MEYQAFPNGGNNAAADAEGLDQLVLKLENGIKNEPVDPLEECVDEFQTNENDFDNSEAIAKILRDQERPEVITEMTIDSKFQVVECPRNMAGYNNEADTPESQDIITLEEYKNITSSVDDISVLKQQFTETVDRPVVKSEKIKKPASVTKRHPLFKQKSANKTIAKKKTSTDCNIIEHKIKPNFSEKPVIKLPKVVHYNRNYVCNICYEVFGNSVTLKEHMSVHDDCTNQLKHFDHSIGDERPFKLQIDQIIPIENGMDDSSSVEQIGTSNIKTASNIQNDDELLKRVRRKKSLVSTMKNTKLKPKKESTNLRNSSDLLKEVTKERTNLVSKKEKRVRISLKKKKENDALLVWGPCKTCQKFFSSSHALGRHEKTHAPRLQCNICHKSYNRKEHLHRHSLTHTGKKFHQCELCHESFKLLSQLQKHHILTHTIYDKMEDVSTEVLEKPFSCTACNARFRYPTSLKYHRENKCNRQPLKCNFCEYTHESQSILNRHLMTHTGEKNYICDICDFKFSRRSHIERHMLRQHINKTWYKCGICSEEFFRQCQLTEHSKTVHGIAKAYRCDRCDAGFSKMSLLKKHILTHNPEKPHQCDICPRKFKFPNTLQNHMEKHSKDQIYTCGQCRKKFLDLNDIKTHIVEIHIKLAVS